MSNKFFQLKTFITYWLDAVDGHSLHSPFFFDFYSNTLQVKEVETGELEIERLRKILLADDSIIEINDLGAGSTQFKSTSRAISGIARTSLSPRKYSKLYKNIINRFSNPKILELGTSLGINTLYLARKTPSQVTTFEGSSSIVEQARKVFTLAGSDNITLVPGNIEHTLPSHLQTVDTLDFVFLDANHRFDPTLNYFQQLIKKAHQHSIFVVDDIHYSQEMENAWNRIKSFKGVHATVDLYRCGIVFFDPALNNQHLVLQF